MVIPTTCLSPFELSQNLFVVVMFWRLMSIHEHCLNIMFQVSFPVVRCVSYSKATRSFGNAHSNEVRSLAFGRRLVFLRRHCVLRRQKKDESSDVY